MNAAINAASNEQNVATETEDSVSGGRINKLGRLALVAIVMYAATSANADTGSLASMADFEAPQIVTSLIAR